MDKFSYAIGLGIGQNLLSMGAQGINVNDFACLLYTSGYIQIDEEKQGDFFKVKTFIEKPQLEFAKVFVESGEFYWNSGIFLWNINTIINAFNEIMPEVCSKLSEGEEDFASCPNICLLYTS